jgi:hypothetical protein
VPRRSSEPAVGGDQDGIEGVGHDEVARVIHADSACQGSSKGLADEQIESHHVERQPQDAVQCAVRLVSAHLSPANRNGKRVGHLREGELRDEPANAPCHDRFDPSGAGRILIAEHTSDEGACVKDRAGGRSHDPFG